jgi:hypothetical protein
MTVALVFSAALICLLLFLSIKQTLQAKILKDKYKDVIDIDSAVATRKDELVSINQSIERLRAEHETQEAQLSQDYSNKRAIYENLLREISILEENLENISYGLYKPHYDFGTSDEFKKNIEAIRERQKQLIKNDMATYCAVKWTVSDSKGEGTKMTKHYSKLMLRAFNGECDAAIAKVSWSNIGNMEARIERAYDAFNKLGATHQIVLTKEYYDLKVEELRLEFELEEKLHQEKEEQRRIRQQMREEEKALREMEKARKDAEDEEERYDKALEKAKADVANSTGKELDALNEKIKALEESLQKARERKERAISQAQLTKSGHIYIISNIGSFGDHVYKIGMTRRLEPLERVNELGDASVPFDFDVHAMIYSENAPELENTLHKRLEHRRMNLVNLRDEFFSVSIDEIEAILNELNPNTQLSKIPEAREYRTTQSIREAKAKQAAQQTGQEVGKESGKFPTSLS